MRRARFMALLGVSALAGCSEAATSVNDNDTVHRILELPERLNFALLGAGQPLAREYRDTDISPMFRQNGFDPPSSSDYLDWSRTSWRGYRLFVSGLVDQPRSYDLATLRGKFERVTQTTRHDCVEGWSVIGKWTGVRLRDLLADCVPKPEGRYVAFHCMDDDGTGTRY
jgi:hypothetical protein